MTRSITLPPGKMHTVKIGAGKSGKKHKIKKHLRRDEDVIRIGQAHIMRRLRLPQLKNQRRNIIWHFCRINVGRAPADGAESSLQMCPEATRLTVYLRNERRVSEVNCLLSQPFPKSSTAGGKSLPSAPCAGIKQRSRKVSCAPMRFNRPRPGSKSRTFCNLCLAKNQRASGRLFLHADYIARAAGAVCSCLALRY